MPSEAKEAVKVTQIDRERAGDVAEALAINSDLFPLLIRNGQLDDHPFVRSYARHREEAAQRVVDWLREIDLGPLAGVTTLYLTKRIERGDHHSGEQ